MSSCVSVFGDVRGGPIDPVGLTALVREARERSERALSFRAVCEATDALHALWAPGGNARAAWLATEPERAIGWSRPMLERGLDHLATRMSGEGLARRVALQLGDPSPLGRFVSHYGQALMAAPRGVLLQVVAGNVFFGPAEALVVGLATGNVSLVKEPTGDGNFLAHFVRSLGEACPAALETVAVLRWKGGDVSLEQPLASSADAILVAAGRDTIEAYRRMAGPTTELVEMGPRLSVAVLSERGARDADMSALARDVALWEQSACTSVQRVYVQGAADASRLARALAHALQALSLELPEGRATLEERAHVAHFRESYAYATGGAEVIAVPGALATVVLDPSGHHRPAPLRRNVTVGTFGTPSDLGPALAPLRGLLQTVALAAHPDERDALESLAVRAGASRVCAIGESSEPGVTVSHDGTFETARLVRWVTRTSVDGSNQGAVTS